MPTARPPNPHPPPPTPAAPDALTLYGELQRLKLDVKTIAPIHGRGPGSFDEFKRFIGKT